MRAPREHRTESRITNHEAAANNNAAAADQAAAAAQGTDDLLPREPCLQALAALRHAKWFQVCYQFCYLFYQPTKIMCFFRMYILEELGGLLSALNTTI